MKSHIEGIFFKSLVSEDGQRFKLNGDLDLRGAGITVLPDNLTVGGDLDLHGTGITTLPDNFTVGGEIIGFKPTQECNNDMGM